MVDYRSLETGSKRIDGWVFSLIDSASLRVDVAGAVDTAYGMEHMGSLFVL